MKDRCPPADLRDIYLTYTHQHPWWYSADDGLLMWHVSADIDDDSDQAPASHVGDMNITLVGYEINDPIALLDGWDVELGHIASVIFDLNEDSELDSALESQVEGMGSQILILHNVKFTSLWRGFGLGPLLAGAAIKRLSGGARAAVCYPAPINEPAQAAQADPDDTAWDRAVIALQRTWARLGFEHFRHGVYVLDLGMTTLDQKLEQLSRDTAHLNRR